MVASSKKSRSSKAKSADVKAEDTSSEETPRVETDLDAGGETPIVSDAAKEPMTKGPEVEKTAPEQSEPVDQSATSTDTSPVSGKDEQAGEPTVSDTGENDTTKGEAAAIPAAEATHPVPLPAVRETEPRNNVFLPLVLGGIIAGAIGYGAAELDLLGTRDADPTAELRQTIEAQQERIAALEAEEPPQVDLSPIETQLSDVEGRIAELEARPTVIAPEGIDAEQAEAYLTELASLQAAVKSQRDEIQGLIDNAKTVEAATAAAARAATAQSALTRIQSAIDAGQPFAADLQMLKDAGFSDVGVALDAVAQNGVATLSVLQSEFPQQARVALDAARASGADGEEQGVGSFLKRQLGVRSVTPREGDDPDAVLSRAEASIMAGDLPATLTELETLPDEARTAIADWLAAAMARAEAQNAADAVSQRLTAD